eukprot:1587220-Rhodomonas_salina.1
MSDGNKIENSSDSAETAPKRAETRRNLAKPNPSTLSCQEGAGPHPPLSSSLWSTPCRLSSSWSSTKS